MNYISPITEVNKFPKGEHFAVIHFVTFMKWDGYSKDNSGNRVNAAEYLAFENEEDLKDWIKDNQKEKFKVIFVKPVEYTTKVLIDLELNYK